MPDNVLATAYKPVVTCPIAGDLVIKVRMASGYVVPERPDWTRPRLAPAGDKYAAVRWQDGAANLWISSGGSPLQLASDLRPWRLHDFHWGPDGHGLVVGLELPGARQRVLAWLEPNAHTLTRLSPGLGADARYAGQTASPKPTVLMAVRQPVSPGFRLQAVTPDGAVLGEWDSPLGAARHWLATGRQAVAVEVTDAGCEWWLGELATQSWSRICRVPERDRLASRPLAFSGDGDTLFALSSIGRDTVALVAMSSPSWTPRLVDADERFDVSWVLMAPNGTGPDLVTTTNPAGSQTALTEGAAADVARLEELSEGGWARIIGQNPTHALAEITLQIGGPALVTLSRAAGAASVRAGDASGDPVTVDKPLPRYDAFAGARTQRRDPFSYRARDGLLITGFITQPDGPPPWPTVLAIHDGPWDLDRPQLDPWAQGVAAVGLACVQVNYRGSRGFGKKFRDAGDRQWSLAMQDDLVDALLSAELSRLVDRSRIGAAGYGYGGYAALMLSTQTQVPLAGVVAASAPTDLVSYVNGLSSFGGSAGLTEAARIGDPVDDLARLAAASPVNRAAEIRAAVMLFHGREDRRVPVSHAISMAEALCEAGQDCELVIYENEGHRYQRTQNVAGLRARAIEFLAQRLSAAAGLGSS
jgi:dienelactone hydrolase